MKAFRRSSFLSLIVITALMLPTLSFAQRKSQKRSSVKPAVSSDIARKKSAPQFNINSSVDKNKVVQSMAVVCSERQKDPLASTPIDVMQAKPSVSLNHPDSLSSISRARRLLPLTRELVIKALQELGTKYGVPEWRIVSATRRIQQVTKVKPDPDLRDNASVTLSEPDTISFGTIFLIGLPSDEGMISVLSHEMVHLADGRQNMLQPLFRAVGGRATTILGMRVSGQKAEELTCDLIGVLAARYLIQRTPNKENLSRRLSRSLQHNCVNEDDTDDDHLSPRTTMTTILSLDETILRDLLGTTIKTNNKSYRQDFFFQMEEGKSLTISRSASYHHRSQ